MTAPSAEPTVPVVPPPEDIHLKLAHELLAKDSDLDLRILHDLLGHPKRYSELKPLLGDLNDHNLTVALKRLQRDGLIQRRTDARREPVVHRYEISPLGIQVVLAVQSMGPIHDAVRRYARAVGG